MPIQFRCYETPQAYKPVFQAMKQFTEQRTVDTADEIWLLEHQPVFTQGQAGKPEHILNPNHIPIEYTNRGGQVTYHGPGQLMIYPLLNLKRLNLGIKECVSRYEKIIIDLLGQYHISARGDCNARGVYVENAKICSIGLRVSKSCSYHGLCLNVKLDLTPFSYINPCGFSNLPITQLAEYAPNIVISEVIARLKPILSYYLEK